jgi:hypothetical protein
VALLLSLAALHQSTPTGNNSLRPMADYNGRDDYDNYYDYNDYDDYDPNDIPADQAMVTPEELYDDYDQDDVPDDQANPGYGSTAKDLDAGDNYDDYDPDDIPDDQAASSGYLYPEPENPLPLMNKKILKYGHMYGQINSFRHQHKNGRIELTNQNQKRGKFAKLNKTEEKREEVRKSKAKKVQEEVGKSKAKKVQPRHSLEKKSGLSSGVTNRKGRIIISVSDWLARG